MRRKYREPEPMRRVAVYEDEESMQPRKRRILFPVLITLFSVIFVVSAAVLVIELIVNPYVTDKNVGEIQKIYSKRATRKAWPRFLPKTTRRTANAWQSWSAVARLF